MVDDQQQLRERLGLALLIGLHAAVCCVSLVFLADTYDPVVVDPPTFHIFFDAARLYVAIAAVGGFALVAGAIFVFAPFSFGYFIGFGLYTIMLSYLWLNCFSDLDYNHRLAGFSAAASALTFLLSALLLPLPLSRPYTLSPGGFDRLLSCILLLALVTIGAAAIFNFRIVPMAEIYNFRNALELPKLLGYLVTMVSSALLPFAFAGLVARGAYWRAGAALALLLLFYPVTLSKLPLLAPFWLVAMLVWARFFPGRTAAVLAFLLPILVGVLLHAAFSRPTALYFGLINFRTVAVPSDALDVYYDYFSRHDFTYFCQISVLKKIMPCPYQQPLWEIMGQTYNLGNLNASLFATEGVASVGPWLAPLSTFACGLVIAFGNRMSQGLPPAFILTSAGMVAIILQNVPLSIVLLSHGGAVLFLLWSVTPRDIFATLQAGR